jgi:hypothetical protein
MKVYDSNGIQLYCGNCVDVLKQFLDHSFEIMITDPPIGMGQQWITGDHCLCFLRDLGWHRLSKSPRQAIVLTNPMPGCLLCTNDTVLYNPTRDHDVEKPGIRRPLAAMIDLIHRPLRLPKPHTEEFDRVIDDQLVDIAVGTHVVTWFTQIEDVVLRTRSPVDYLRRDQPIGLALFSRSLCYRQSATFALIPLENSLA